MFFKLAGSEFHEHGPETEKERGPKVLVRVRGMRRLPLPLWNALPAELRTPDFKRGLKTMLFKQAFA